jgi:hypothetical protein
MKEALRRASGNLTNAGVDECRSVAALDPVNDFWTVDLASNRRALLKLRAAIP